MAVSRTPVPALPRLPPAEKIIMGVDPGTQILGFALIEVRGQRVDVLTYDVLNLKPLGTNHAVKLKRIFSRMLELIDEYLPDELAIEAPFFGVNVQSMLKLGRAQGVVIAACLSRDIPFVEYAPTKVKQAVTGSGAADKEQVARSLRQQLTLPPIEQAPKFLDATDALAVALCHHYQQGNNAKAGTKSWDKFLADNPARTLASTAAAKKSAPARPQPAPAKATVSGPAATLVPAGSASASLGALPAPASPGPAPAKARRPAAASPK